MNESWLNNAAQPKMQNELQPTNAASISRRGTFPFRIQPTVKGATPLVVTFYTADVSSFEWSCGIAAFYKAHPSL